MNRPALTLGDLVEHWTLMDAERGLVAARQRDTQLGFALLIKFYGRFGRFPRGRSELHPDAVEYLARALGVTASSLGFYEWSGRTMERHRAEIRRHFGFRECTVTDAAKLTDWLADGYTQRERRFELVREELLAECRQRCLEPPSPGRVDRIVRSGLHQGERLLAAGRDWWRVAGLLGMHPQAVYTEHGHTLDALLPPASQRPDLAVIYTAGLAAPHDLDPRFGIDLDDFGPDHPLTGDPAITRLRAAAGLLGEDIWIAVTLPNDDGEDEPDTAEAITQWTSVAIQPQDLQWLREVLALNTEPQEGPQDDEDDPGLE